MLFTPTDMPQGLAVALLLLLGSLAFAQDDARSQSEAAEPEQAAEEAADEQDALDEFDDPDLDEQGFDPTADDDFIPSEDIPAGAPIDFPTDI